MRVLAIDTALEACAAAVLISGTNDVLARESLAMSRGHAEALMPLIARVMDAADCEFSDLDRIAVTTGPGSFTGLRVGIAAARGIALVACRPAIGISTLSAYAAPHLHSPDKANIAAAIDAKHGNVYLQIFANDGRTLVPAQMISAREAVAAVPPGPVHLVGSGASVLALEWPVEAPQPAAIDAHAAPDIQWVGLLGSVADPKRAPARPLYLRGADAHPQTSRLPQR